MLGGTATATAVAHDAQIDASFADDARAGDLASPGWSSMNPGLRFLALVVLGLGSLTWAAMTLVNATTRAWFERDINLRTHLAVKCQPPGSRAELAALGLGRTA